jgi:hypothetical protein
MDDIQDKAYRALEDIEIVRADSNPPEVDAEKLNSSTALPPKGKGRKRLTKQMNDFAGNILKGMSQSEAYKAAYNAENMKKASIATEAWKLMRHPEVAQIIGAGMEKKREVNSISGDMMRSKVLERLWFEATEARNDGARIRALELLGKVPEVGLFTASEKEKPNDIKALERIVGDKLKALGLDATIVDSNNPSKSKI